jgi:hypothetical protein
MEKIKDSSLRLSNKDSKDFLEFYGKLTNIANYNSQILHNIEKSNFDLQNTLNNILLILRFQEGTIYRKHFVSVLKMFNKDLLF